MVLVGRFASISFSPFILLSFPLQLWPHLPTCPPVQGILNFTLEAFLCLPCKLGHWKTNVPEFCKPDFAGNVPQYFLKRIATLNVFMIAPVRNLESPLPQNILDLILLLRSFLKVSSDYRSDPPFPAHPEALSKWWGLRKTHRGAASAI